MPTNNWNNLLVRASGEDSSPEEWLPKEKKAKKPTPKLFHPGVFVKEEMEARGWSIETLVERAQLKRQAVEELLAEKRSVTPVIAHCLAQAFDTSKELWMNLQAAFDGR